MFNHFRELEELELIQKSKEPLLATEVLTHIKLERGKSYPLVALRLGNPDPKTPTLGLFGGVHGLERIGGQIILAYFRSLLKRMEWDKQLRTMISKVRIVSIPIVNPGGMAQHSRCNPAGVDLMRNAPVEAEGKTIPLVSGHRLGPWLPWYRGKKNAPLEMESSTLIEYVRGQMLNSPVSLSLDIHSGFGLKDQIWFPYAYSRKSFPRLYEAIKLKELLDSSHPHHIYKFEPQSVNYITHGDLWDHLFFIHQRENPQNFFLPLTLELGSWSWIKKNPLQFFSRLGLYHPIKEHRYARTMRRHVILLDFLLSAVNNVESWSRT